MTTHAHEHRAVKPATVEPTTLEPPAPAVGDPAPDISHLMGIAGDALGISPPLYFQSIFGTPSTWVPPYRRFSEYGLLSLWRPLRALKFLQNTWVPSIPRTPPAFNPPFINDLFWQPTVILQRPDHNGNYTSFPEESWFLINGIMTNDAVAQLNAALLAELFHRPITLIQNATSSLLSDLLQCALDKEGWRITEPVTKALPAIYDALKDDQKERVVVVAHSQGTIIAAVVLRLLKLLTRPRLVDAAAPLPAAAYAPPEFVYPDDSPLRLADFALLEERELAKLEIYCFATCANAMTYWRPANGTHLPLPYVEHFGNENDIVASLGMLAPDAARWGIRIDGPHYMRRGAWGHLLNAHYLYPIADAQRRGRQRGGTGSAAPFVHLNPDGEDPDCPRLFAYINGGSPLA